MSKSKAAEQAESIVSKYKPFAMTYFHEIDGRDLQSQNDNAVECAKIEVKAVIDALSVFGYNGTWYTNQETRLMTSIEDVSPKKYWQSVLAELEKM
jgi:hypothetical protein